MKNQRQGMSAIRLGRVNSPMFIFIYDPDISVIKINYRITCSTCQYATGRSRNGTSFQTFILHTSISILRVFVREEELNSQFPSSAREWYIDQPHNSVRYWHAIRHGPNIRVQHRSTSCALTAKSTSTTSVPVNIMRHETHFIAVVVCKYFSGSIVHAHNPNAFVARRRVIGAILLADRAY